MSQILDWKQAGVFLDHNWLTDLEQASPLHSLSLCWARVSFNSPLPPPPPPDVLSLSTNAAVTWSSSFTLQVKSLLFTEVLAVSLSYHFSKFDLTVLITKVPAQSLWLQPHTGQPFLLVSYLSSQSLCMPNKCRWIFHVQKEVTYLHRSATCLVLFAST